MKSIDRLSPVLKFFLVLFINFFIPGLGNLVVIGRSFGNCVLFAFCFWAWTGGNHAITFGWAVLMAIKAMADLFPPGEKGEDRMTKAYPLKKDGIVRTYEPREGSNYASSNFNQKLKELEKRDFDAELVVAKHKQALENADDESFDPDQVADEEFAWADREEEQKELVPLKVAQKSDPKSVSRKEPLPVKKGDAKNTPTNKAKSSPPQLPSPQVAVNKIPVAAAVSSVIADELRSAASEDGASDLNSGKFAIPNSSSPIEPPDVLRTPSASETVSASSMDLVNQYSTLAKPDSAGTAINLEAQASSLLTASLMNQSSNNSGSLSSTNSLGTAAILGAQASSLLIEQQRGDSLTANLLGGSLTASLLGQSALGKIAADPLQTIISAGSGLSGAQSTAVAGATKTAEDKPFGHEFFSSGSANLETADAADIFAAFGVPIEQTDTIKATCPKCGVQIASVLTPCSKCST